MLKIRIITALVILPIVLVALFAFPKWAWGLFTMGIALVGCWEWGRFCRLPRSGSFVFMLLSLCMGALILVAYLGTAPIHFEDLAFAGFVISALFWIFVAPLWLVRTWRPQAPGSCWIMVITGWVVVFPTWLAFLFLQQMSPWILLTFALIVWIADVAAYFVGKSIGRHKLAPSISPGKTIEGAIGGMIGVALYYFAWQMLAGQAAARGHDWARELLSQSWLLFAMFLLLGVLSVLGDLFESWMKRGVGMKDSSNLLPGHGGVLDRIDALTSTLPVAGLYLMMLRV